MFCTIGMNELDRKNIGMMSRDEARMFIAMLAGFVNATQNVGVAREIERFCKYYFCQVDKDFMWHGVGDHACRLNYDPGETCPGITMQRY